MSRGAYAAIAAAIRLGAIPLIFPPKQSLSLYHNRHGSDLRSKYMKYGYISPIS